VQTEVELKSAKSPKKKFWQMLQLLHQSLQDQCLNLNPSGCVHQLPQARQPQRYIAKFPLKLGLQPTG
jgi:hypothetical protein